MDISIPVLLNQLKQYTEILSLSGWLIVVAILSALAATIRIIVTKIKNRENNYKNDPDLGELLD